MLSDNLICLKTEKLPFLFGIFFFGDNAVIKKPLKLFQFIGAADSGTMGINISKTRHIVEMLSFMPFSLCIEICQCVFAFLIFHIITS